MEYHKASAVCSYCTAESYLAISLQKDVLNVLFKRCALFNLIMDNELFKDTAEKSIEFQPCTLTVNV